METAARITLKFGLRQRDKINAPTNCRPASGRRKTKGESVFPLGQYAINHVAKDDFEHQPGHGQREDQIERLSAGIEQ
jgi:hypothetical protein